MTVDGTGFGLTDDEPSNRHTKKENKTMDSHMAQVLVGMADEEYRALMRSVEAERKKSKPALDDGAALLQQSDAMRIPGGELTPRMRRMLADANGDSFTVQDGRAGREFDLG